MQRLRIKKGFQAKVVGAPAASRVDLPPPKQVAACPLAITLIKPRLLVKEQDHVRLGAPLFEDKRRPNLKFLSPGGGTVVDIRFGPRRVVEHVAIELAEDENPVKLPQLSTDQIETADRGDVVQHLIDGGLWPLLRALPFRDIADETQTPPALFVFLDDLEPFQPDPEAYLQGRHDDFAFGLKVLGKLCPEVTVCGHSRHAALAEVIDANRLLLLDGRYPAVDPGVVLYHTRKNSDQNTSWYVYGQDLLLMAELFKNGRYPVTRTFTVGGAGAGTAQHVQTRLGAPVRHLLNGHAQNGGQRYLAGGIFRGRPVAPDSFLGLHEVALTVIPEGADREFMALFKPGWAKPTYSRAFVSKINPEAQPYNCNRHGGLRACIACMHCADVCPVDILPNLTYKAILAEEVEEYLQHGLLDCVECGLCSFVCPSKIELTDTLVTAKREYRKEREGA